jgi:flagellar biosynthesis protein FlhA
MVKKEYKLEILPKLKAEDVLAIKRALDIYYKENKNKLEIIPFDDIVLEIGIGLISLVASGEGNLVDQITRIREDIGRCYGILPPRIRIVDNTLLDNFEYCIKIKGKEYGKYKIDKNKFIAIDGGKVKNRIKGKEIKDPVFNIPAILINKKQVEEASEAGYTIADAYTIISTHLSNILETNLDKIFSYQNTKDLLAAVKKNNPSLVDDILKNIKFIDLKYILEKLITKKVSLGNIEKILELILININESKNIIVEIIEKEMKL